MSLDLNERVSSRISVIAPNTINSHPGGVYKLGEDNNTEEKVVRLHLLQHFIDMMMESYCDCAENNVILGAEIDKLGDKLFNLYKKFIEAGVNIFEYRDYFDPAELTKYHNRPIISNKMNAGPDEQPGVPNGWFFNFPYTYSLSKFFNIGRVIVDVEGDTYRVGVYEDDDNDEHCCQSSIWLELTTIGDLDELYTTLPDIAGEVVDAIRYLRNNQQI